MGTDRRERPNAATLEPRKRTCAALAHLGSTCTAAVFAANGTQIVAGTSDGEALFFDIRGMDLTPRLAFN